MTAIYADEEAMMTLVDQSDQTQVDQAAPPGEPPVAAFDRAALHSIDPRELARLTAQRVARLWRRRPRPMLAVRHRRAPPEEQVLLVDGQPVGTVATERTTGELQTDVWIETFTVTSVGCGRATQRGVSWK